MEKEKFESRNIFEEELENNTDGLKNWDDFEEIELEDKIENSYEEDIDSAKDIFIEEDYTLNDLDSDESNKEILSDKENTVKKTELVKINTYDGLPSIEDIESMEIDDKNFEYVDEKQEFVENAENDILDEDNSEEYITENIISDNSNENNEDDFFSMDHKENKFKNIFNNKNIKYILLIFIFIVIIFILLQGIGNKKDNKPISSVVDNKKNQIETDNYVPSDAENIVVDMTIDHINKAKEETLHTSKNNNLILPSLPDETPIENKETKSYFNSKYNISFEYPLEWEEIIEFEYSESSDNVENVIMVGILDEKNNINNMRISIEDIPVSITSKEYIEKTDGLLEEVFPKFQSMNSGEITVSGREAPTRMYIWVPQTELDRTPYKQEWSRIQQYQIYVSGKTKMYVVTFTANKDMFLDNFKTYENILKTLTLGD